MLDREDVPRLIAEASAAADVARLTALAIDLATQLAASESAVHELRTADETRRAKQAKRTRESRDRNAVSRDVTLQGVTERDRTLPPSPQVSSSSPTPLITPSFPPSPPLPPPPQGHEEQRLQDRAPEAWPVVMQFLEGKDQTARTAWIGRFHGALDRPPHPTGQELADALGDLMTTPRDQWVPTLFRRYVERIRRDATRDAESPRAKKGDDDAGELFAKIRAMVNKVTVHGQASRTFIRRSDVEALGERALRAYDNIGGADRFTDPDEQVGFVLRDFEKAYRAARPSPAGAPC